MNRENDGSVLENINRISESAHEYKEEAVLVCGIMNMQCRKIRKCV